jgi:hypothetical protein
MGMPHMRIRQRVSVMIHPVKRGPAFAFGIDGNIYLSVFELDGVSSLDDVARVLHGEPVIFVGVLVGPSERRRVARHLVDAGSEAAAYIAGGRRWKKR